MRTSPMMIYSDHLSMYVALFVFYEDDLGGSVGMWSESDHIYRTIGYSFN